MELESTYTSTLVGVPQVHYEVFALKVKGLMWAKRGVAY